MDIRSSVVRPWLLASAVLAALAGLLGLVVLPYGSTTAAAATALPGGKANYVAVVISDKPNASWVRLAEYSFRTDGTVHEAFWYWNMATFTGDGNTNKVSSGYLTHGCPAVCQVRTPKGFEVTAPPKELTGQYYHDVNGNLVINWPAGQSEAWKVQPHGTWSRLDIITSNYGVTTDSWAFGSNASLSTGATIDEITAAGQLTGEVRETSYEMPSVFNGHYRLDPSQFVRCTGAPCLQAPNVNTWRANIAAMPTRDGRRAYFDHQRPNVAPYGPCPANPQGHTTAMLQIVDDDNRFLGFVYAEASLNRRVTNGGAIISSAWLLRANP